MQIRNIQNMYLYNTIEKLNLKSNRTSIIEPKTGVVTFGSIYDDRNFIQKGWDKITGNERPSFQPSCSIVIDEDTYLNEITAKTKKMLPQQKKEFYNNIYKTLSSNKEKALFRQHFGKYLPQEQPQQTPITTSQPSQNNNGVNTTNMGNPHQVEELHIKPVPEIRTTKVLITQINSMKVEDIPSFISELAKRNREEQYNLLEAKNVLSGKHAQLLENDPLTIFRKEAREKYSEQLNQEVEEEFRRDGKKHNSTDVIKEKNKRLKQMEIDAGLEDYSPKTLELGKKLYVLTKQMEEQNISFVPRAPEKFASEMEKQNYVNAAVSVMSTNEASVFDALNVFEKYGEKRVDVEKTIYSLETFTYSVESFIDKLPKRDIEDKNEAGKKTIVLINKVLQRYLDVFSKFATKRADEKSTPDVKTISSVFKHYSNYMNKETMLYFIEKMEQFAVDKEESKSLAFSLNRGYFLDSTRYFGITSNDIPDIQKAVDKLEKKVENLPDDYRSVQ